jgi:hypothetical protein
MTSDFALTNGQVALAGTGASFHDIPPFHGEDAAAQAASIPTIALVVAALMGAGTPRSTRAAVATDTIEAGAEDPLHELGELDELPGPAVHAAALLQAWHISRRDGRWTPYRREVLRRPSFEAFVFDQRLIREEGGAPLDGVVVDSDRPLLVRMSSDSGGAVAVDHERRHEGSSHGVAIVLEPGDAVALVDPDTGDGIVLARDRKSGKYAWAETAWSWSQARTALQSAPLDSAWVNHVVVAASEPEGDARAAVAWLGARLRDAPRRTDLDSFQARYAWRAWRAERITEPARLLAEEETTRVLAVLEDLLNDVVPPSLPLGADDSRGAEASTWREGPSNIDVDDLLHRASVLRSRIDDLLMIGGPLADRVHALPRVDRMLDRVRSAALFGRPR